MKAKINDLNDGQLVIGDGEYCRVKKCIHGNLYYANVGKEDEALELGYTPTEIADAVEVFDIEEDHISHCCG